jgi:hypothetical protein
MHNNKPTYEKASVRSAWTTSTELGANYDISYLKTSEEAFVLYIL